MNERAKTTALLITWTSHFGVKSAESIPQGLKPTLITFVYAGDKSLAYPKTEFFRSL
jgi:hypothetical protein